MGVSDMMALRSGLPIPVVGTDMRGAIIPAREPNLGGPQFQSQVDAATMAAPRILQETK